jgi:acetyl esterase
LVDDGHVVILPDYRVRCRDGSSIDDALDDARAAYAWVVSKHALLGIDPAKAVVGGESAGGHLALMTAIDSKAAPHPAAVLLFNPVVDLAAISTQLWIDRETAQRLSPLARRIGDLPPTLILHGTADTRISFACRGRAAVRAGGVWRA